MKAVGGKLHKRSMRIAGHRTSVALEPEFWAAVDDLARVRGVTVPTLIAIVDQTRAKDDQSLASALRVAALTFAQDQAQARAA